MSSDKKSVEDAEKNTIAQETMIYAPDATIAQHTSQQEGKNNVQIRQQCKTQQNRQMHERRD